MISLTQEGANRVAPLFYMMPFMVSAERHGVGTAVASDDMRAGSIAALNCAADDWIISIEIENMSITPSFED